MDKRGPRRLRDRLFITALTASVMGLLALLLGGLADTVLDGAPFAPDWNSGVMGLVIGLVIVPAANWGSRWGSKRPSS